MKTDREVLRSSLGASTVEVVYDGQDPRAHQRYSGPIVIEVDEQSSAKRAEFPSLAAFFKRSQLTTEDLQRPLLFSVNQWAFSLSAFADIAVSLRELNSCPILAMWAQRTPMADVGTTTRHRLAHFAGSKTRDERVIKALRKSGFPPESFIDPPIRHWKPAEPIVLPARLNRSSLRAWAYRGTSIGRAILQIHPDNNTPMTDAHEWPRAWVELAAHSYAYVFDQVLAAIAEYGASALLAYNGRFLHDRAAFAAAETAGIPTLYYDSGGTQSAFDLTDYPTHDWVRLQQRMLAMYENWPEDQREDLGSSWFERRRDHLDPENAGFVDAQHKGEAIDIPPGKSVVVYFSSSGDEVIELDLDWSQYFYSQEQALQTLATICREDPDVFLVVRSHPHKRRKPTLDVAQWHAAVETANPDAHLDEYSSVDSYALMNLADVVVTYGSTTGAEAAYAGKPVVVMGPSTYGYLDCATEVHDSEELRRALKLRQLPSRRDTLALGLMFTRRGFMLQHVEQLGDRRFRLAGVEFKDAPSLVQHASHWLNLRRNARLVKDR